ncbi:tRNA uridine-5-carboxymethylaminomethyl(34) synthesis GTPase MnmE [Parabacteroides sp. An277]|uniref:tRNA uridine-5-carboxymethylaminomethyl(34) synthesis GTPase MnmE n=1 Tax=Parabacteroides sp. An277 TaxID=1965619 RepID=UPI000B3864B2|nr:tRNA uridine-5-carboxymethylaminomethyl(34) synthesis GTPase MnmE [Parabacteroides sp. An277]OUO51164.1 tRNA uridine-5-carboxymethylaminomethyl(34) synthesis GTPase MnmE [Parabacteroides sp. An277]
MSTICAISTAPGVGGIAVIRVSGTDAFALCDKIFHAHREGHTIQSQKAYTLQYGTIENERGETVDNVVIAVFRAPHSFTGEDTVEISCHGSIYIQQQILQLLIQNGCELAKPGEFTQRAFLNGKMDLSQAEAVADLIASTSAGQHRLAMSQMRGGFSRELKILREKLLHITSLMELELDFADHEELEFADRHELKEIAAQIEQTMSKLIHSFKAGNAIKNGIPVAIVGETNAGKSTLLNALLNEEKAIVSDIHGTTRDIIEDTVSIQGQIFRFIDTAGIRDTHDTIEVMGIERSFHALDQAQIILWVIDSTNALEQITNLSPRILPRCQEKELIVVFNKSDLPSVVHSDIAGLPENTHTISISAKQHEGLNQLQTMLIEATHLPQISQADIIITNARHYEALTSALHAIQRVEEGLSSGLSGDFISQDLRECIYHLSDIMGEVTTDEVLGNIFRNFCIGK